MLSAAERVEVLRRIAPFSALTAIDLEAVAARLSEVSFVRGGAVFRGGDPGDALFLLVKGKVAIREGSRNLVTLTAPDCFGELAVLSNEPRSADAICEESCDLLRLRAADLRELLATRPAVQHEMMMALVRRVREAGRRQTD